MATPSCDNENGEVVISGLAASTVYALTYTYNSGTTTINVLSDASGNITFSNLADGTYSNISVEINGCTSNVVGPFDIACDLTCTVNAGDIPQVTFCEGQDPTTVFGLPYVDSPFDGDDSNGIFDPQFGGSYGAVPSPESDYSYTYVLASDPDHLILEGPDATANFDYANYPAGSYRVYIIVWRSYGGTVDIQDNLGGTVDVGDDVENLILSDASGCLDIAYAYMTINPSPVIDAITPITACDELATTDIVITGSNLVNPMIYDNANGTGIAITTITTSGTYYAYDANVGGCTDSEAFDVTITPSPQLDAISDIVACDSFDATTITVSGTNLNNPQIFDNANGTGTPITTITTSGNYWLYDEAVADATCNDAVLVKVTINTSPSITLAGPICDEGMGMITITGCLLYTSDAADE